MSDMAILQQLSSRDYNVPRYVAVAKMADAGVVIGLDEYGASSLRTRC
jgi:hypothetical protein